MNNANAVTNIPSGLQRHSGSLAESLLLSGDDASYLMTRSSKASWVQVGCGPSSRSGIEPPGWASLSKAYMLQAIRGPSNGRGQRPRVRVLIPTGSVRRAAASFLPSRDFGVRPVAPKGRVDGRCMYAAPVCGGRRCALGREGLLPGCAVVVVLRGLEAPNGPVVCAPAALYHPGFIQSL